LNPIESPERSAESAAILENRQAALRRMQELRKLAIDEGMKLLSLDEINEMVARRT
jgi:hypothetical protein